MNKFKRGDVVYVYRKARPWIGGYEKWKQKAFLEKWKLIVVEYRKDENGLRKVKTRNDEYASLTFWEDCLKLVSKPIVIIVGG